MAQSGWQGLLSSLQDGIRAAGLGPGPGTYYNMHGNVPFPASSRLFGNNEASDIGAVPTADLAARMAIENHPQVRGAIEDELNRRQGIQPNHGPVSNTMPFPGPPPSFK